MIKIKSEDDLTRMRISGGIAARVLEGVASRAAPGVTTKELDDYAAELTHELGAKSSFLGYRGYPGHICVSVNDEVVHGIPGSRVLKMEDVVSIDVGVEYDGFVGDNAKTVAIGVTDPDVLRLLQVTRDALEAAIEQAMPGNRLSDISHSIEKKAKAAGFSVVREFVGHGIGRDMHEDPQIPNFGPPGRGPRLKKGMTLAIEPMINLGVEEIEVMPDGWTVLTKDRKPSAHFEHTVALRDGQAEILTRPENV